MSQQSNKATAYVTSFSPAEELIKPEDTPSSDTQPPSVGEEKKSD